MKILAKILIGVFILIGIYVIIYVYSIYAFAVGFSPGNIGVITYIENDIKGKYYHQYIDSFFVYHPEFSAPDSINQSLRYKSLDYDHLSLSKFYFSNNPNEVYYVQMDGFVNIRFVYNPITEESFGSHSEYKKEEVNRVKKRFETEIIPKFEKVILKYESKDSIYY